MLRPGPDARGNLGGQDAMNPTSTGAWTFRSRLFAAGLALALLSVAGVGNSQEPNAADVSAARKLGVEGVKLANLGKCDEAIERLARAEKLYHATTILGRLGECQIALGKIVQGTENLQRVVREPLPANPPAAFVAARSRAQKALDAALPKIAHIKVIVQAPPGAQVTVKIDGDAISEALVGESRPTDPGEHTVLAVAPDCLQASRSVSLSEGQDTSVTLTLDPDPKARKAPDPSVPKLPPSPPSESANMQRVLAYASLGVGGAGLAVGSIFGFMAMSKHNNLEQTCFNKVCPPSSQGDIDAARSRATVSTVGFIVAGVGVAAGATLLLWPDAAQIKTGQTRFQPWIGVGSVGLNGAF
jgi:hypothetical protein